MRGGDGAFIQGYNAQAAVDAKHQIIVAAMLTPMAADAPLLIPMVDLVRTNLGRNPANSPPMLATARRQTWPCWRVAHSTPSSPPGACPGATANRRARTAAFLHT